MNSEGDVIGKVCKLGKEKEDKRSEVEHKVALSAVSFLGKKMEQ